MEDFHALLKKHKLKATPQRVAVHEAMLKLEHASADMVSDYISQQDGPKITVSSVYNILSQFALLGIYRHRMSANNKMYFDVWPDAHIHLYDIANNTYKNIIDEDLYAAIKSKLLKKRFKGLRVEGIDVQIVCRPSKSRKASKK